MTYTLKISCDNSAFGDDETTRRLEIDRILRETANSLDEGEDLKILRDVKGNTVGKSGLTTSH